MANFTVVIHGRNAQQVVHTIDDGLQMSLLAEFAATRGAEFVVRKRSIQCGDKMKQSFSADYVAQYSSTCNHGPIGIGKVTAIFVFRGPA